MPIGAFRLNTISNSGGVVGGGWLMYNTGARASNITPGGFEVDASGNIYILDMYSSKLAKIDSTGAIQWQKYVSTPAATGSHSDGGILCLSPNQTYLYAFLPESSTSMSLCQFLTSNGNLNASQIISATTAVYPGSLHTSTLSTYTFFGVNASGTLRMMYRRYNAGNNTLTTSASQLFHLGAGATSVNDVRASHDVPYGTAGQMSFGYQTTIGMIAPASPTLTATRTLTGGFDSIVSGQSAVGTFIMKDNIIGYWTTTSFTKSWEYTHTISSVGGSHYYQQGMIADSLDNIYACYWNSTAGKIVIYKVNKTGTLQWTKSITPTGYTATSPDAMTLKLVGTSLYLAFKYGDISGGGMAILKIPTDGTGTKTFANSFVLANETGTLTSSTSLTLTTNTPATTTVTIGTTGNPFTLSNATLPTYTQSTF